MCHILHALEDARTCQYLVSLATDVSTLKRRTTELIGCKASFAVAGPCGPSSSVPIVVVEPVNDFLTKESGVMGYLRLYLHPQNHRASKGALLWSRLDGSELKKPCHQIHH